MLAIGSLAIGGSEKQLTELVCSLPRDRFDPILVTSASGDEPTRYRNRILASDVPILAIPTPPRHGVGHWIGLARQYAAAIRTVKPDLVYAWLDETAAFVAPICRVGRIPCLVARRNITGSSVEKRYPLVGTALRRAESLATLVTANSDAVAAACVMRGHDPSRVRLVPNGHERLPALPSPPSPPVVFGYVAQFRDGKGHHHLLDVVGRVPDGPWRVDLAGEGPLQGEIAQLITNAGLRERVRIIGPVADVREFWRERHVAMLLSDSEGFPNAILEAAFAGRPAIATRVGGTPEVVGEGGILVPLHDLGAAASAMVELIGDAALRQNMGHQIWEHVADAYSIPRMLQAHVEALEEAHAVTYAVSG